MISIKTISELINQGGQHFLINYYFLSQWIYGLGKQRFSAKKLYIIIDLLALEY